MGVEGGYCWYDPASGIPYLKTDDAAVTRLAADHLLAQGHRRLAYCGLPKNRHTLWSEERARAFRERAREPDVVAEVAVSRSAREARFREVMGGTIRDEIQRTMLDRAQALIAEGGLTLKQVANEAGFAHVQHMTNLFRRRLGHTPGAAQRTARLGPATAAGDAPTPRVRRATRR